MAQGPITELDRFLERLEELIDAAERGGVDPAVLDYFREAGHRARHLQDGGHDDRRFPVRFPTIGRARLVTQEEAHEVSLLDQSDKGFGILSPVAVPAGSYARLDIEEGLESHVYESLVSYCRPEGAGYRLGLETVSYLHIGSQGSTEP